MVLLIMAAGSGSRYGKLKQFDDLGPSKEFLLEFSIYDAVENGFDHIVLITKKENKDFLYNYLRPRISNEIKIDNTIAIKQFLPDAWIASNKKHAKKFITWIINTDFYSLHYNDNQKAINLINKLI